MLEFFLINWLGSLSISSGYHQISFVQTVEDAPLFNIAFGVLAPTVFLVLTAAVWYAIGADGIVARYWLVTVFYVGVRWSYNIVMGRAALLRWPNQGISAGLAIMVSYLVSSRLLSDRAAVLPSARALTDELWIVVIGFLYITASRVSWPALGPTVDQQRASYLHRRFRKLQRTFGPVVSSTAANPVAEVTSYAVMIYESFNRPAVYQWIENVLLFPTGLASTLGPMQVSTPVRLPPADLVREGVRRVNVALDAALEELKVERPGEFATVSTRDPEAGVELTPLGSADVHRIDVSDLPEWLQDQLVSKAAAKYNIRSDYPEEVAGIYGFLRQHYFRKPGQESAASA